MRESYRPRFSRRTLKALLLVLPGLILLLTSLDPGHPDTPAAEQVTGRSIYWLDQPDSARNEVRLIYATDLAVAPGASIVQQALATGLASGLKQAGWPATVTAQPDRLQLRLRFPASDGLPDLKRLLPAIAETLPQPARLLEQAQARDYLAGQKPDQLLLNRYRSLLQPPAPANPPMIRQLQTRHRDLGRQTPLILIGGPAAARLAALAEQAFPALDARQPEKAPGFPQPQRLQLQDARLPSLQLLGGPAPGRDDSDYATELLAFDALRQVLDQSPGLRYRLYWQPLHQGGFRALVLPAAIADPRSLLDKIPETIRQSRRELLQAWRTQLESPDGQLDLLADIAFYRLPYREPGAVLEALEAAREDDIAARMTHYLDPEPRIRIGLAGAASGEW